MTDKQFNMIDSLFYYMYNAWSKEECSNVKWHHMASHFWDKWSGFYKKYGPSGAIAPFIFELDNDNRRALYERANQLYDGKYRTDPKKKARSEYLLKLSEYLLHSINAILALRGRDFNICEMDGGGTRWLLGHRELRWFEFDNNYEFCVESNIVHKTDKNGNEIDCEYEMYHWNDLEDYEQETIPTYLAEYKKWLLEHPNS